MTAGLFNRTMACFILTKENSPLYTKVRARLGLETEVAVTTVRNKWGACGRNAWNVGQGLFWICTLDAWPGYVP